MNSFSVNTSKVTRGLRRLRGQRGFSSLPSSPFLSSLPSRRGYIFLLAVLVIGAIAIATTVSMLYLGLAAERNAYAIVQSSQALQFADTCAERAIRTLRSDISYAGSQTITLDTNGSCTISAITGSGPTERILCVEGTSGTSVRRLEIHILQVLPTTIIKNWIEVSTITQCL